MFYKELYYDLIYAKTKFKEYRLPKNGQGVKIFFMK